MATLGKPAEQPHIRRLEFPKVGRERVEGVVCGTVSQPAPDDEIVQDLLCLFIWRSIAPLAAAHAAERVSHPLIKLRSEIDKAFGVFIALKVRFVAYQLI